MRNSYLGNCGHGDDHEFHSGMQEVGFATRYDPELDAIVFSVYLDADSRGMSFVLMPAQAMAVHDLFDNAILDAVEHENSHPDNGTEF